MRKNAGRIVVCFLAVCLSWSFPSASRAGTTGGILGQVSDASGHPLADVRVSVTAPSASRVTVTGANGFYSLNGLPLDTYSVTFTKDGYQSVMIPGITVTQDQSSRVNGRMEAGVKSLGRVTVRSATSLIQPTQTADTYVINQTRLENLNGTPQDLNGFQAFNSLPGVTTDNFGYPVIRGGAENDVGYQFDGVDNTDAVTGQFLNAVSLNGARSVQLSTGGYDVSSGNTNTGVINEVIKRGTYPAAGQATFRMIGPTFGHEMSFDYGNATPDNRFSYYFSYGGQRNDQDYGDRHSIYPLNLALTSNFTLNDEVFNLFYHWGKGDKNELQFLNNESGSTYFFGYLVGPSVAPYASNNFNNQINNDPYGLGQFSTYETSYITLYPGQAAYNQNTNMLDTQTFNTVIDKLNYKRQLSPSSFGEIRLYKTVENLIFRYPYDLGSFSDFYEDLQTTNLGEAFDYTNQISSKHEISFGGDASYYKNQYSAAYPSFETFYEPLEEACTPELADFNGLPGPMGGCYIAPFNAALNASLGLGLPTDPGHAPLSTYANNLSYTNDPLHRYDLYIKDHYQPNEKWNITLGLRFDKEALPLPANVAEANTTYFFDDNGNFVTVPGQPIGNDVTHPSQVSPRLAMSYELSPRDTLRFSYGKNIEFVPESALEDVYQVNPALQNCNIASGCFVPLPGFGVTNHVSNLYQQIVLELTTNEFQQYTPVRPQRATNVDFGFEHDFGHGLELRIEPYYRKGTDYVVGNQPLLFTLASGTPVFGPSREENAGINVNTGVEVALQRQSRYGLSGLLDATYDNTLANYDSDFFPTVNNAALAAGHFFHVTYVAPVVGTLNLVYNTPSGLHASTTVSYESGYRYGVGKKTFTFLPNANNVNVPVEVLNSDLVSPTSQAYYFTDPANPGTVTNPNITGSRGTPEGDDPGTLRGPQIATVLVSVSHDLGRAPHNMQVGIRVQNLFNNFTPTQIPANLYYVPNALGGYGPGSGVNVNAPFEPFQYNQSPNAYENESFGPPRLFTFFMTAKY
ncbi:MAG: hypothetical protein DLM53_02135 [Candidatus Eremiobacter antarcticus]|nr:TonB-dependent receptor [Candidatus Eremiobacteraeota bacterium]MBC5808206.1 TonB-dependent receptor [Candidatus Eremiobacteraeota bacterium]PZR63597.1 MAG: hypothetical protein DLM53_02135 [Candidatus Eremiobacter sp. RRmetagenome_bin22]